MYSLLMMHPRNSTTRFLTGRDIFLQKFLWTEGLMTSIFNYSYRECEVNDQNLELWTYSLNFLLHFVYGLYRTSF